MKFSCKTAWLVLLIAVVSPQASPQATKVEIRRLPLAEARPFVQAYAATLPKDFPSEATRDEDAWGRYINQKENELQSRLEQGDLDTLANLLLFGTSYTKEPVLTPALLREIAAGGETKSEGAGGGRNAYQRRLQDLAIGIAYPKDNERLQYMQALLRKKGMRFATGADYNELGSFLAANLVRMLKENQQLADALQRAREGDPDTEFRERSQVFEQRGISLDTSIFPNFAIEESLKALRDKGIVRAGTVRRVAIVGPGLDTINKDIGFDYYPEQTLQPFAVANSLLLLGLAKENDLQITTLDISDRVNSHILAARKRAQGHAGYAIQLPIRSNVKWTEEAMHYWEHFGAAVGVEARALAPPASVGETRTRAVQIRPGMVLRVLPRHLDVIYERLKLPEAERFDLIVGTNIFVYYDAFEQSLAELNLASMLREHGVVLTNDALPVEGSETALSEIGFGTTVYSDRKKDGDRVVWLKRRQPLP